MVVLIYVNAATLTLRRNFNRSLCITTTMQLNYGGVIY